MGLREYLTRIGEEYDPAAGFETTAQDLIRQAHGVLGPYVPLGYRVVSSGGQRPLGTTTTPWIGVLDPEETTSPQQGLYVVLILRKDRSAWVLAVLMGTERLADGSSGERQLLEKLRSEAALVRREILPAVSDAWDYLMDLKDQGRRQARYEAATIVARTYDLASLPSDDGLAADLRELLRLNELAVIAKRRLGGSSSVHANTPSPRHPRAGEIHYSFVPGSEAPAVVRTRGTYERTPRHETGLARYGQWLAEREHKITNHAVHPRDFLIHGATTWLGEYKVVYGGNDTRATREAHSQLKEYRYFLHAAEAVRLLAVFSEPISRERVSWLLHEEIESVWFDGVAWRGTIGAVQADLALP